MIVAISPASIFVKPKHFEFTKPSIDVKINGTGTDFTLDIASDTYARSVELDFTDADGVLEDNYIDLVPDRPVRLSFKARRPVSVELLRRSLTVRSVYDIGRG